MKILILTTELTGSGHKSVSDSIEYSFGKYKDVNVEWVEIFTYGGKLGIHSSKIYSKTVKLSLELWHLVWKSTSTLSELCGVYMGIRMRNRFLEHINQSKPDFILSVQPISVKSTNWVLNRNKIKIPFGVLITDVASISKCWLDKDVQYYFCTTEETKRVCLDYGILPERINMVNYPLAKQYMTLDKVNERQYDKSKPLKILLLSGGDGVLNFERIALNILSKLNSEITIITGNNKKLKSQLETNVKSIYKERIEVKGFINNLSKMYLTHDIAIIRASPNVMFEAAMCNIPSIIVSFIPGQESDNCDFAQKNGIAITCLREDDIVEKLKEITSDDGNGLRKMKSRQKKYIDSMNLNKIEDVLYKYLKK